MFDYNTSIRVTRDTKSSGRKRDDREQTLCRSGLLRPERSEWVNHISLDEIYNSNPGNVPSGLSKGNRKTGGVEIEG